MKRRIIRFLKTDLFKTSFLNGIANLVKILTGLVSNKIVAVYLGPSGIALLGQFQNFATIIMSSANLGINPGITKYTAEYNDNEEQRKAVLSTGFYIVILGSLIASLIVFFGRNYFSDSILHTSIYTSIFVLFAITLILFVLNSFFIAVLNGYKEFKKIITTNIISSFFGLAVAIILVINYGVYGAFLGYILSQTLVFFITIFWVVRSEWFSFDNFIKFFKKPLILKLGQFSLMSFTTLFASSFIQLQLRTYIMGHLSLTDAGYWQGIIRICDLYIVFVTTTISIYYLPRLAELKSESELRHEIFRGFKFILPLVILSSIIIFFLRYFIINILFASSFSSMSSLFLFQLMGNIIKIASFLLSYLMVAKAMTKIFVISEITSGIIYYIINVLFINKFGVVGATYAYFIHYCCYFIFVAILFRKILLPNLNNK